MGREKKRIAILGGGIGSIAAAFALTDEADWKERYDITLYQLGWRIGGKGASGRNSSDHERIEEHGLHIWLGFYDNSFRAMKQAYEEIDRPADKPLARCMDAFKRHSVIVIMEHLKDSRWIPWQVDFPENEREPGVDSGEPIPTLWSYMRALVKWMHDHFMSSPIAAIHGPSDTAAALRERSWVRRLFQEVTGEFETIIKGLEAAGVVAEAAFLYGAYRLVETLDADLTKHRAEDHHRLVSLLDEFKSWLWGKVGADVETNDVARRLWILLELGTTIVTGIIRDGVLFSGLKAIEKYDFIEWLKRHEASELSTTSAPVRGLYDLVFGYEHGDVAQPNFAAGTALRSIFSMLFDYQGAIFWKMQAGMGDTVFGPFYQVLKRRGVRFEFFHKVENLGLSEDRKSVATIRVGRQVWLKGHDQDANVAYEPLVEVKDLPCWPSEPLYDQIEEAAEIKRQNIDLESYYSDWPNAETRTLKRGEDFDLVILGIPPGAHRFICQELIQASPAWREMVDNVQTVQTQAVQLWLTRGLAGLGWERPSPILDAYVEPLNTWADMSQLIDREAWPEAAGIRNISYFCGPLEDAKDAPAVEEILSGKASSFPQSQLERVRREGISWLEENVGRLWPQAAPSDGSPGLNPEILEAAKDSAGLGGNPNQFYRANIEPSERYVLSLKGSSRYRLKPGESGFDNLYLAGDWVDNGFLNAGCIEATVISGLLAAQALSGHPIKIFWLQDNEEPAKEVQAS